MVTTITNTLSNDRTHSITTADTLANAIRLLTLVAFDLIILDLMLPYITGGRPDSRAGLELLRQLRSQSGVNRSTQVVGLSAFPDEIESNRSTFDEHGVLVAEFDESGAWNTTLTRILEDARDRSTVPIDVDFLVICALEEERTGFRHTAFEKISEAVVSGLNVHYARLPASTEIFGGIIRLSQTGLVAATFETAIALSAFRTKSICMSGICAGFSNEANLGQLIVASPAWEYQAGKWSANGFEIAPMQVPLRPETRSIIDLAVKREEFARHLEEGLDTSTTRPRRQYTPLLAPFATGSAVIADVRRLEHVEKQHRKVAALDMETFGVYFAAHESTSRVQHYFSIKCVVDLADAEKNDDLHDYGCIVAARGAEFLTKELLVQS